MIEKERLPGKRKRKKVDHKDPEIQKELVLGKIVVILYDSTH
jgi:hypothetical protein